MEDFYGSCCFKSETDIQNAFLFLMPNAYFSFDHSNANTQPVVGPRSFTFFYQVSFWACKLRASSEGSFETEFALAWTISLHSIAYILNILFVWCGLNYMWKCLGPSVWPVSVMLRKPMSFKGHLCIMISFQWQPCGWENGALQTHFIGLFWQNILYSVPHKHSLMFLCEL